MWLKFTKMHGAGNDFVVIDAISQSIKMTSKLARKIANRQFGIGCDQILVVEVPSRPDVDFNYRIFNNDGSEVEQCGNGARCFAKFVRDRKLCARNPIRVSTAAGVIEIEAQPDNTFSVDMGAPSFSPSEIPLAVNAESESYSVDLETGSVEFTALSMGNPHAVITVDDVKTAAVDKMGSNLETHEIFPNKANIGFMQFVSDQEIKLRVFERGAGETLACGTGACAAAVSGIRGGRLKTPVKVNLPGGILTIDWQGEKRSVILTGSAKTVFHGQIRI